MSESTAWATIAESAEKYSVSTATIRRMIARGDVEATRIGPRLIRVDLNSLQAALRPVAVLADGRGAVA